MCTPVAVLLLIACLYNFGVDAKHVDNSTHNQPIKIIKIRDTPENCIFVSSQTGYFTYESTSNSSTVCAIYLMTESQNLVEITFAQFDVPCGKNRREGGLVEYLDGWELQKQVFPSLEDVSKKVDENIDFCSNKTPLHKTFISSQNGAEIIYRIPQIGKGFTILVNHKKHPSPCNIIHIDEPYYLLQNYGKKKNCSIWAPYPTAIQFNSYDLGNAKPETNNMLECVYAKDHIEIGGGHLDTNRMQILDTICEKSEVDDAHEDMIGCSSTTIKLVSGGNYNNMVNISMRPIDLIGDMIANVKYSCTTSIK